MFPLKDNIPTERFPVVTVALIALNVIAYFFWQKGGISFGDPSSTHYLQNLSDYGASRTELPPRKKPGAIATPAGQIVCGSKLPPQPATWITPFTAMFMHGGLLHLGGNMLF